MDFQKNDMYKRELWVMVIYVVTVNFSDHIGPPQYLLLVDIYNKKSLFHICFK